MTQYPSTDQVIYVWSKRKPTAGCSKSPFSKAAASGEARRYVLHFV
jgi:hypothetical protein